MCCFWRQYVVFVMVVENYNLIFSCDETSLQYLCWLRMAWVHAKEWKIFQTKDSTVLRWEVPLVASLLLVVVDRGGKETAAQQM